MNCLNKKCSNEIVADKNKYLYKDGFCCSENCYYYMNYIDYCQDKKEVKHKYLLTLHNSILSLIKPYLEQSELDLLKEKRIEKKVKDLNYWKTRCELAEAIIMETDDDDNQKLQLYNRWTEFKLDENINKLDSKDA